MGNGPSAPKLGLNVETSDLTPILTNCEETHYFQNLDLGGKRNRLLRKVWNMLIKHGEHLEFALWLQSKRSCKWTLEYFESGQKKKHLGILISLSWSMAERTRKDGGSIAHLSHTHWLNVLTRNKREASECSVRFQNVLVSWCMERFLNYCSSQGGWKSFLGEKGPPWGPGKGV